MQKTNVMRLLEVEGIPYEGLQQPRKENIYKTLVTVGKSGNHYVFVIPVGSHLNLKKAARAAGEKSIQMIKERELEPLTGYVHGGCSPIGMKKTFETWIDQSAQEQAEIIFSAGKVGYSVQVQPSAIKDILNYTYADLTN